MGGFAGVDLAISTHGDNKANLIEMMIRKAQKDERATMVLDLLKRGGPMKHWTGETIALAIGHLPEETKAQKAIKLSLAKQAMYWYFHLNSPFNHFLALKVADQMADNREFRAFMKDFYETRVKNVPVDDEENFWLRFFFQTRPTLGHNSFFEWVTVAPAAVKIADRWTEKAGAGLMKHLRNLKAEVRYAADVAMNGKEKAVNPADVTLDDIPEFGERAPELPQELQKIIPGAVLSEEQFHLLERHMSNVRPPVNPIRPMFRDMYERWVEEHDVDAPTEAELLEARIAAIVDARVEKQLNERLSVMGPRRVRGRQFSVSHGKPNGHLPIHRANGTAVSVSAGLQLPEEPD